jgi:hypothetical protein
MRAHTLAPTSARGRPALRAWLPLGLLLALLLPSLALHAAPKADLWPRWEAHQADSEATIDHAAWGRFLERYLVPGTEPALLRYGQVSDADRQALEDYLDALQAVAIADYNRDEQMAYWVNLYNAATVALILREWPVDSIRDIKPSFFSGGPWDMDLLEVDGEALTLNDIEHRILRPIWQDPRIHYAVNCASIGCPSLAAKPYTGARLEAMLNAGGQRPWRPPGGRRTDCLQDLRLVRGRLRRQRGRRHRPPAQARPRKPGRAAAGGEGH